MANTGYSSHPSAPAAMRRDPDTLVNDTGWFSRLKQRFPILNQKRGKALVIFILCLPLLALLGLLALRNKGGTGVSGGDGASGGAGAITDDAYFYGQSEPVYPSRKSTDEHLVSWVQ